MNPLDGKQRFPKWLVTWWWIAVLFAAPYYVRILYEQTLLTWREGRQSVGFSLAHLHPEVLMAGLLGCALLVSWIAAAILYLALKKKRPASSAIIYLAIPSAVVLIGLIPYDIWAKIGGAK